MSELGAESEQRAYLLARAHTVGVLGRFAFATGLIVMAAVLAAALKDDLSRLVEGALALALTISLALTCLAAARVLHPPVLLRLDDSGYRLRVLRGAGRASAAWTEVARVRSERLAPGLCLVVSLTDGARTVVPLNLVQGGAEAADRLESDLRARLDRAHGQRRLR